MRASGLPSLEQGPDCHRSHPVVSGCVIDACIRLAVPEEGDAGEGLGRPRCPLPHLMLDLERDGRRRDWIVASLRQAGCSACGRRDRIPPTPRRKTAQAVTGRCRTHAARAGTVVRVRGHTLRDPRVTSCRGGLSSCSACAEDHEVGLSGKPAVRSRMSVLLETPLTLGMRLGSRIRPHPHAVPGSADVPAGWRPRPRPRTAVPGTFTGHVTGESTTPQPATKTGPPHSPG